MTSIEAATIRHTLRQKSHPGERISVVMHTNVG